MPPTIFALSIDGGWSTEYGPTAPFQIKGQGAAGEQLVAVPWLVEAQNVIYNLDGWPQKMPGAANVNAVATGSTDSVVGIYDYWRSNTSGSPTQQRLAYAGTQIYRESGGTMVSIATGLEADVMPWFEVMNDACVIATTSTVDVPRVWDQTTMATLGGSPPNFAFHVVHKDRLWAAGVETNKARLYYSAQSNHEDWTGAGSGSIDIPYGGQIAALWSHNDQLIIFMKNPEAIFRLTGSAPTGADAYVMRPYRRGVGAANQQSIIVGPGSDLWFWDDGGIHSLAATDRFGDYAPEFLSAQIATYFTDSLNHNRLDRVWGVNFVGAGYALWTASQAGATTHDVVLVLDYRFQPFRFALWNAYDVASLAMVRDSSRQTIPWAGTYTGRALRMHRSARNLGGNAYTALARLPALPFGDPFVDKMVSKGRIGYRPKSATTFTVAWQRDGATQQTAAISQAGDAMLGDSTDNFVLDTDTLAGARYLNAFFDMTGSFKEIQLEVSQGTVDVDMEPHGLALEVEGAGIGTTGVLG